MSRARCGFSRSMDRAAIHEPCCVYGASGAVRNRLSRRGKYQLAHVTVITRSAILGSEAGEHQPVGLPREEKKLKCYLLVTGPSVATRGGTKRRETKRREEGRKSTTSEHFGASLSETRLRDTYCHTARLVTRGCTV